MPTLDAIRSVLRQEEPSSYDVERLANQIHSDSSDRNPREIVLWINDRVPPYAELFVCDHLEVPALLSDAYVTHNGSRISEEAYNDSFFTCSHCDEIYHQNRSNNYRDGNGWVCDDCTQGDGLEYSDSTESYFPVGQLPSADREDEDEDEDEDEPSPAIWTSVSGVLSAGHPSTRPAPMILSYSTNVLERIERPFRYMPDERLPLNPLWLGVELEVEPRGEDPRTSDYVKPVFDAVRDFAIMKQDASLGFGGFEIVTVPATLAYHRQAWLPFFNGPSKGLNSWRSGRCGMHVHISRAALSDLQLGHMLVFINAAENRGFIEKVAGRGSVDYSYLHPKKVADVKRASQNHRDGLAFTDRNGGKTVELRIFRGNVSPGGFFKNLDATVAISEFCREAGSKSLTDQAFLRWLDHPGNRRTFPFLARWAAKQRLIATPDRVTPAQHMKPNHYVFETV